MGQGVRLDRSDWLKTPSLALQGRFSTAERAEIAEKTKKCSASSADSAVNRSATLYGETITPECYNTPRAECIPLV
jgi:hypothetical protein